MLPSFYLSDTEILIFGLILIRVSAFIVAWPVFSVYSVPNHCKVLFALALAIVLMPTVPRAGLTTSSLNEDIMWLAGKEVLVGLILGFMTRLFFFAINIGGNLVATSTGLMNAHIFNPSMNTQTTTVEQFYATIGTLLFLALNGHHYFIQGLAESFIAIPLSLRGIDLAIFKDSGMILQIVTEAGIKISAPVLVAIFVVNVAMGIVGRAVPQINVLVTSMNVNFMAGLIVMIVAIPALMLELDHQMIEFAEAFFKFMRAF